jgi:hypothetical protein
MARESSFYAFIRRVWYSVEDASYLWSIRACLVRKVRLDDGYDAVGINCGKVSRMQG